MKQVEFSRSKLAEGQVVTRDLSPLGEGAVRLAIESFSVTANNVTYAVMGDSFRYWHFFPASEAGRGIVPMWGHARVVESNHPEIAVGERVYGYMPFADTLDVVPGKVSAAGFSDTAAHRQPMSPIYNQYSRLAADPEHDAAREGERMIFGPLFKTGFLIENFMRGEDWFGAEQAILTSASSKTAMGLASVARDRSPQIARIGLTSAGNVGFVTASGLYHHVFAYEDIEQIVQVPSVSVDFAGNSALLRRVHAHLGDALKYSCLVGATHVDAIGGGDAPMPGPQPVLFFAPDHAVALFKSLGPEEAARRMAESWRRFLADASGTVEIETIRGLDEGARVFARMATGELNPAKGIVVEP